MRTLCVALLLLTAPPIQAGERICIDQGKADRFIARVTDDKSFILGDANDASQPGLAVTTSCMGLQPTDRIGLSGTPNCVAEGQTIQATPASGNPQACQVTRVKRILP